jgi:hypothetical protein
MPRGDIWPTGIVQFAPRLVLIEAEMNESPHKMAGLRSTAADRPRDFSGKRVWGALSSCSSYLKNDATSRSAAKPIPNTYGSLAVKITLYASAGLNPFFMQICVGSGVPGKGFVALQLAQA